MEINSVRSNPMVKLVFPDDGNQVFEIEKSWICEHTDYFENIFDDFPSQGGLEAKIEKFSLSMFKEMVDWVDGKVKLTVENADSLYALSSYFGIHKKEDHGDFIKPVELHNKIINFLNDTAECSSKSLESKVPTENSPYKLFSTSLKRRFEKFSVQSKITTTNAAVHPDVKKYYGQWIFEGVSKGNDLSGETSINTKKFVEESIQKGKADPNSTFGQYSEKEVRTIGFLKELLKAEVDLTFILKGAFENCNPLQYHRFWSLLLMAYKDLLQDEVGKEHADSRAPRRLDIDGAFANGQKATKLLAVGQHLKALALAFHAPEELLPMVTQMTDQFPIYLNSNSRFVHPRQLYSGKDQDISLLAYQQQCAGMMVETAARVCLYAGLLISALCILPNLNLVVAAKFAAVWLVIAPGTVIVPIGIAVGLAGTAALVVAVFKSFNENRGRDDQPIGVGMLAIAIGGAAYYAFLMNLGTKLDSLGVVPFIIRKITPYLSSKIVPFFEKGVAKLPQKKEEIEQILEEASKKPT